MARGKGEGSIYRRKSDGMWCATIELPRRLDEKRRRKTIVRRDKAALIAEMRKLQSEKERTGDLETSNITVEKWMTYWLEKIVQPNLTPNAARDYRNSTENFIIPAIGKKRLHKLSVTDVHHLRDAVLATPRRKADRGKEPTPDTPLMSPASAQRIHACLQSALTAAMRAGKVSVNVAELAGRPRAATVEQGALTTAQAKELLRYLATHRHGPMFATFLLTGARRGEVIGLEVDRVGGTLDLSWQLQRIQDINTVPADYEHRHVRGSLYLVRPKSKAGWRTPPVVPYLRDILNLHLQGRTDGFAFLDDHGQPWDPAEVSKAWRNVLAEAGMPQDVKLHGLRHTAVDLLDAVGTKDHIIQQIVGHSSRAMTNAYRKRGDIEGQARSLEDLSNMLTSE
jgi:integrase